VAGRKLYLPEVIVSLKSIPPNTGYARLAPRQARAVLAVIVLVAAAGVAVTLSPLASSNLRPYRGEAGDAALYRAEVDRIHRGEGYYQAAAAELTARGYPTRSVFNWRTPLPVWLLGKLPTAVLGKALLGGLALALVLMAFEALSREEDNVPVGGDSSRRLCVDTIRNSATGVASYKDSHNGRPAAALLRPIGCALLLTGPLMPTLFGNLFTLPVLWAGVLIALSAAAYGINRPRLGVSFGLAAVFCRELALPYCVLCVAIAWWHGRRRELALWSLGLAAWLVFFGWHWWQVHELMAAGGRAHREGWVQFGGAGFVISTAQMNAYLLLLPQWVTALYLVAALVGFAGWSTPLGTRVGLAVCLYLMAFAVVGQSFNQYWGALIAPLLCFGVARLPASLGELWRARCFSDSCEAIRGR
jgi:hypothetical protein